MVENYQVEVVKTATAEYRKRRKIGNKHQKMSATVAGEIDVNKGMPTTRIAKRSAVRTARIDPADEELIRRSSGSTV